MVTSRRQLGDRGESIAARHLAQAGLELLGANLRTPSGEIDLLARDGADLVFVEVRTRRGTPGAAAESLSTAKVRRMWRCAMEHCEAAGLDPDTARLDAVVIDLGPGGAMVEHLRGLEVPGGPGEA